MLFVRELDFTVILPKWNSLNNFQCRLPVLNFSEIHGVAVEINIRITGRTYRQTNMTSPFCVCPFVHLCNLFLDMKHSKYVKVLCRIKTIAFAFLTFFPPFFLSIYLSLFSAVTVDVPAGKPQDTDSISEGRWLCVCDECVGVHGRLPLWRTSSALGRDPSVPSATSSAHGVQHSDSCYEIWTSKR